VKEEEDPMLVHLMWLRMRLTQLQAMSTPELRRLTRTFNVVWEYLPLHDYHERMFLEREWVQRRVFSDVKTALLSRRSAAGGGAAGPARGPPSARGDRIGGDGGPGHQQVQHTLLHNPFDYLGGSGDMLRAITLQPINEVRDYFGEEIAVYFAFMEEYTQSLVWPSIASLACLISTIRSYLIGSMWSVEGNSLAYYFHVFMCLWTVQLLATWKRRQNELTYLWGTENYQQFEEPRDKFLELAKDPDSNLVHFAKSELTGKLEPVAVSPWKRYVKMACSILLGVGFCIVVYFGVM